MTDEKDSFMFSKDYKTYVENFMKDGKGNWAQVGIAHELAQVFDAAEGEDFKYIATLLGRDERLRNLIIRLENVWYERWVRACDEIKKLQEEKSEAVWKRIKIT